MKRWAVVLVILALVIANLLPIRAFAHRQAVPHPLAPQTTIVIRRGFPITHPVPRAVVVRPARTPVIVTAPLIYMAPVMWAAVVVPPPALPRLVWADEETIYRDEQWTECNFGVDGRGLALYLEVKGKAQLSFAEVTFGNGQILAVDFQDKQKGSGIYRLADFSDGRIVKTVRLVAMARSDEARLKTYLLK